MDLSSYDTFVTLLNQFFSVAIVEVTHFSRLEQRLGLGDLPGRLVGDLLLEVAVEHAEEIVVGTGHDGGVVAVPAALELVKDAVVFVQAAQL